MVSGSVGEGTGVGDSVGGLGIVGEGVSVFAGTVMTGGGVSVGGSGVGVKMGVLLGPLVGMGVLLGPVVGVGVMVGFGGTYNL
jgi:hypothetical protein